MNRTGTETLHQVFFKYWPEIADIVVNSYGIALAIQLVEICALA